MDQGSEVLKQGGNRIEINRAYQGSENLEPRHLRGGQADKYQDE